MEDKFVHMYRERKKGRKWVWSEEATIVYLSVMGKNGELKNYELC